MKKNKYNEGDWIFFTACAMWIILVLFYFSGAKELANELTTYILMLGLGGIGISKMLNYNKLNSGKKQ